MALLLVLLVFASDRLFHQQETRPTSGEPGVPLPDAYARDVRMDILGADGRRIYQLRADTLEYYPDSDRLQFTQPRLELVQGKHSHWSLTAEHGYTSQAGDPVWLLGKVIIQQLAAASGNPLEIRTRDVLVKPDERTAETGQPASVTGMDFQLDSVGIDADFRHNRVQLRSRVRGILHEAG
jgi:LPS export ABC transporter protein LptC